jgi:hypothetical protein
LSDTIPNRPLKKTPKSKGAAKESKKRFPSVAFFVSPEVGIEKKSGNGPRTSVGVRKKKDGKKRATK